jgi:hypothetical protein
MLFGKRITLNPRNHSARAFIVWHLPINITTGPELDSNWFKVANQH